MTKRHSVLNVTNDGALLNSRMYLGVDIPLDSCHGPCVVRDWVRTGERLYR